MHTIAGVALLLAGSASAAVHTFPVSKQTLTTGRNVNFATTGAASKVETSQSLGTANIAYFATLSVGTPPVDFLALLDTGSSDLVIETAVQSNSCSGCTTTGPLYNPSASTTANVTDTPIKLVYGIGSDSGVAVSDVVKFGGFSHTQTMAACDVNDQFSNLPSITALLGLGLQTLAQTNATPFVQQLAESGQLDAQEFGMAFAFGGDNYQGPNLQSGGYLTIGGANESFYTGNLNYVNVFDAGASVDDIAVNGVSGGAGTTAGLIDSGTNGISLPTSITKTLYSAVGGGYDSSAGAYLYPCSTAVNLAFSIGGQWYNMSSDTFQTATYSGSSCLGAVRDGGSGAAANLWILGSSFMENFYVSFRFSPGPAIGFATLADPNNILDNSPIPSISLGSQSEGTIAATASGRLPATATTVVSGRTTLASGVASASASSTPSGKAPRAASVGGATFLVVLAGVFVGLLL